MLRQVTFALATLFACVAQADYAGIQPGELLQVRLDELHPTQAVIGHDQVHYKLGRYAKESGKLFDDFCEANGQGESASIPRGADLHRPDSFECQEAVGAKASEMKTVVIGPQGRLYLTDGHHTFTSFWEATGAGSDLKVWVRVVGNHSDATDRQAFWQRLETQRQVWLKDGAGRPIRPEDIPPRLGLDVLADDPYRALVYFTREVAYDKPRSGGTPPEFLEFYWGEWLRGRMTLERYDLHDKGDYLDAIEEAARLMVSVDPEAPLGQTGFTARQLGGYAKLDRKELNKVGGRKLPYALAHKASR